MIGPVLDLVGFSIPTLTQGATEELSRNHSIEIRRLVFQASGLSTIPWPGAARGEKEAALPPIGLHLGLLPTSLPKSLPAEHLVSDGKDTGIDGEMSYPGPPQIARALVKPGPVGPTSGYRERKKPARP